MKKEQLAYYSPFKNPLNPHNYNIYDTHVHSEIGHGCDVNKAVARFYERGVTGGALLGHTNEGNFDRARELAESMALRLGVMPITILWGNELSTRKNGQDTGHLIVVAADRPPKQIEGHRPITETIMEVYDAIPDRFALIVPHPEYRPNITFPLKLVAVGGIKFDEELSEWFSAHPEYRHRMGIEVLHHASMKIQPVPRERVLYLQETLGFAPVGGSDAHQPKHIGGAATAVPPSLDFFAAVEKRQTVALLATNIKPPTMMDFYFHGGVGHRIQALLRALYRVSFPKNSSISTGSST